MNRSNVNEVDNLGNSQLMYAAASGNESLCEMLLRVGAKVNM